MNWRNIATSLGLRAFDEVAKHPTVDDIQVQTAIAANVWALSIEGINEEPFPSAGKGDNVLNDAFDITGWGWVWLQRQFWLKHKKTGIESRWINGRKAPMKVIQKELT